MISIIGPNGRARTTIFNCLTGFYRPSGGVIRCYKGEEIQVAQPPHRPQGHSADFPARAPVQGDDGGGKPAGGPQHRHLNTGFIAGLFKTPLPPCREKRAGAVRLLAGKVGLGDLANRAAGNLALRPAAPPRDRPLHGGDRPELLMLDEPAAGLNPRGDRRGSTRLISNPEGRVRGLGAADRARHEAGDGDLQPHLRGQPGHPCWPTANRTKSAAIRR